MKRIIGKSAFYAKVSSTLFIFFIFGQWWFFRRINGHFNAPTKNYY
jgi:hypothetical protein